MRINFSRLKPFFSVVPLVLLVIAVTALVLWPRSEGEQTVSGDWTCSMHPQVRLPNPGKCPICGMDLIPVSQLKSLEDRAGVETEVVMRRELFKEIRTVGKIDYNETRVAYITARMDGRVDRLYVDFTGIDVENNDHLVDIYSPSLVVAQEELLRALDAFERQRPGAAGVTDQFLQSNLESARDKLRLWGILPEQIAEFERTRKPRDHVTLYAPIRGTVIEKNVRVGQYVKEGDLLYRIAELDPIWLYLDIYEYDIAWVRYGQSVDVSLEAMPGETIRGMVTFIDPFLNESTRTVKVRVNLPNPDRRLKPGMYASATIRVRLNADGSASPTGLEGKFACPMHPEVIQDQPGKCSICQMELKQIPKRGPFAYVGQTADHSAHAGHEGHPQPEPSDRPATSPSQVPTPEVQLDQLPTALPLAIRASAVLDTGRRRIAYRKQADGAFELVPLTVGPRAVGTDEQGQAGIYYTVLDGLSEKDEVVVRAGFLLDSQRQIEGMPSLFFPAGAAPAAGHAGHGGHAGHDTPSGQEQRGPSDMDKMRSELQKLSPEDRASAEKQHICPVTGKMLGTMGPPQKVDMRGRQVWICCPGCRDELLNNAEKYLAKLPAQ
jgi:Cu(I)/Ag(I) efflux system membrane fusion protein